MKMNRPNLIRKIYAELRDSAVPEESSSDLLLAATEIAELYLASGKSQRGRATYYTGGIPFDFWSVDRAIADGGWRLLRTESELVNAVFGGGSHADDFEVAQWLQENVA